MTLRKCWGCHRPIRKGERVVHRSCADWRDPAASNACPPCEARFWNTDAELRHARDVHGAPELPDFADNLGAGFYGPDCG